MGTRGQVSHSQASRCTREFPGGLRRTWRLPGRLAASALGVFRGKSQLAVHSGTSGTLRRCLRKGSSKAVSERVSLKGVPERVFEGGCEGVCRKGFREGLPEGFRGRAALVVGSMVYGPDLVGQFGPGE